MLEKLKKSLRKLYKELTNKTSEEMAKKLKYEVNTPIIIYKETPTFIDGGIGLIIERDPFTTSYGVVLLGAYYAYDADLEKLMRREMKWVAQDNLIPITFDKPKPSLLERIKNELTKLVTRLKNRRRNNRK